VRKELKICFVAQNIYPLLNKNSNKDFIGGAELQQVFIGEGLAKRGHQISFITMNHGQNEIEELNGIRVISTFKPDAGIPVLRFFYPRLYKIWKALRKSDTDVYYVRCAGFILAPVVLYAHLKRKKVVYCGAYDTDFDPEKIVLPYRRDKMMYFWALKRCNAVIVQNVIQQNTLKKNFHLEGRVVHNGLSEQQNGRSAGEHILWVANFLPRKHPHLMIKLAKRFPQEKFVMIGGATDQKFKRDFLKQAEKVGNLEVKGYLPFKEANKEFGKTKLLVNTSDYEGFPNTFLQAWSHGVPVISFVDPDDLITENRLGVRVKNINEMTQKVNEFLGNKLTFSCQAIKDYFEKNLTIEKTIDKHEEIFQQVSS